VRPPQYINPAGGELVVSSIATESAFFGNRCPRPGRRSLDNRTGWL